MGFLSKAKGRNKQDKEKDLFHIRVGLISFLGLFNDRKRSLKGFIAFGRLIKEPGASGQETNRKSFHTFVTIWQKKKISLFR